MSWEDVVNGVVNQARGWAEEAGFATSVQPLEEMPTVKALTIENGRQRIQVEPAMYAADRVPTAVDIYAYPSLIRVRLHGPDRNGAWEIFTADNIPLRRSWSARTFLELCSDLTAAA